MFKSIYSKSLFILALLFVFTGYSRAQSFKRYGGRDNNLQRLDSRSYKQRYHHDDFRNYRIQRGNRFRQHRHVMRNRCAHGIRRQIFRNGISNGYRLRENFENRNFRNRGFNENRLREKGRRGSRIRSL